MKLFKFWMFFLFVIANRPIFSAADPVLVFQDAGFLPHKDYTAEDVVRLLTEKNVRYRKIDHAGLESLSWNLSKLLILPYVRGNFSKTALERLVAFHQNGGGILILGDFPNKDKWYPLRNMQSSLLHLTRSSEGMKVEGLTAKGKEILGESLDLSYFDGKNVAGVKTTAYPPGKTYNLILNNSDSWAAPVVVAVDRKGNFLGARFAIIGANGGEPRENVDGAYQMEWEYNPGMLTREWEGIEKMVWRLSQWILNRLEIAGQIDLVPVHREGEGPSINVRIKNFSDQD
ncbi:hypothetical protein JW935_03415, partial [candidate division KSB1 bacterium]|nr:hypothetical protein [candidate division KSB1 bacterium]